MVRAERAWPVLGTVVSVRIHAAPAICEAALAAARAEMEAVQAAMSFHDRGSALSRLNRQAHLRPQEVAPQLWRVLRASLALARASDGCFDPSVGAALVRSGHLPAPTDDAPPAGEARWHDVELLPGRRVRFHRPLWLDLGGIAKGHAVDRAVAVLRRAGVEGGTVNAGGDLRVFGPQVETVRVRDPRQPARTTPLLQLRDGAAATSSDYFSRVQGLGALVATGPALAASGLGCGPVPPAVVPTRLGAGISVTVCAPRAIWADALTKVVLADASSAVHLLRQLHAQAALLDSDGTMRTIA